MKTWKKILPLLLALLMLAGCGAPAAQETVPVPAAPADAASADTAADGDYKVLNVGRMAELFDMDSTILGGYLRDHRTALRHCCGRHAGQCTVRIL